MKGMFAELINEIGKQLNVKVQWSTEILHDQIPTDLASNRYDMLCGMLFATPTRAREMAFTKPLLIHPAYLFVRADDHRFDNNYEAANDPSIKFAILDGEYSAIAANERYPRSQKVALPQNSSGPELLLNVSGKKADVVATEMMTFALFNKSNPGQLRRVDGPPESIVEASFPLPLDEPDFKNTIDTTMTYLHGTGFINKLLDKYETTDIKFLRMPKPYVVKEGSNTP
jgi:ABC-type amino acid transport substrate-binding protein